MSLTMNQPGNATKRQVVLAFALGASTMLSAQVVDVQPRSGRPTAPRSGACFYRDPGFRGPYFCASSGENIPIVNRVTNNQISSIRTFGDTEVTIFQDPRFAGRWTRLEGNVANLRNEGWNDRLSSVWISPGSGRDRTQYDGRRNGSGLGPIETGEWRDRQGADGNGQTDRRDGTKTRRYDPNDRRDGAGIGGGYPNDRKDGTGTGGFVPSDRRDPNAPPRVEKNDPRSSTSPGWRTGETADVIVRRLYQEVFQREVDPEGLTLFRNHMTNDNWSEQDVRDALLKSPEYRQRATPTPEQQAVQLVARAYRAILGREPDPASHVYVGKVLREHWTEEDVSKELRNSHEYRTKHPH